METVEVELEANIVTPTPCIASLGWSSDWESRGCRCQFTRNDKAKFANREQLAI